MAYPLAWETDPPTIPERGAKVSNQISQFASELRKQAATGALADRFSQWLYDFERLHPPVGGSTFRLSHEITTTQTERRELQAQPQQQPEGAMTAYQEGRRIDRILDAVSQSIDSLRMAHTSSIEKVDKAYSSALSEVQSGFAELKQGYAELRTAYAQVNADYRSLLGVIFPNVEAMYKTHNESMEMFRRSVIKEAEAKSAIAAAQAPQPEDPISQEAGKAVVGLLAEAAKVKFGLTPSAEKK